MHKQCMVMQKTPVRSQLMVQQYQCKPIIGVLLVQLLKTRVVSLVIRHLLEVLSFSATR